MEWPRSGCDVALIMQLCHGSMHGLFPIFTMQLFSALDHLTDMGAGPSHGVHYAPV